MHYHGYYDGCWPSSSSLDEPKTQWDLEMDNQDEYLQRFGLYRRPVEPDGNCLFRALSVGIYKTETEHRTLRCKTVNYIAENFEDFKMFFEGPDGELADDEDIWSQLTRLSRLGTWGGYESIMAVSRLLKLKIYIVLGGSGENSQVSAHENHYKDTSDHADPGHDSPSRHRHSPRRYRHHERQLPSVVLSWLSFGHYDCVCDAFAGQEMDQIHRVNIQSALRFDRRCLSLRGAQDSENAATGRTYVAHQTRSLMNNLGDNADLEEAVATMALNCETKEWRDLLRKEFGT